MGPSMRAVRAIAYFVSGQPRGDNAFKGRPALEGTP
jgi:hypothetical protein